MEGNIFSQPPTRTFAVIEGGTPCGYVQQTVTTAANLSNIPLGANRCVIQPETGDVRYRDDGTAPTSSVGMYLSASNLLVLESQNMINAIQLVAVTGSVNVNISFYRK